MCLFPRGFSKYNFFLPLWPNIGQKSDAGHPVQAFKRLRDRQTLCEKRPYSELFWSVFSRILTEYGEIRSANKVFHANKVQSLKNEMNQVFLFRFCFFTILVLFLLILFIYTKVLFQASGKLSSSTVHSFDTMLLHGQETKTNKTCQGS